MRGHHRGKWPRHRRTVLPATVAVVLATMTAARSDLTDSPITSGFWSFADRKAATAQEIAAACRDHFQIRFPDGRFIGLKFRRTGKDAGQRAIEEVGRCMFDREKQIDRCEIKYLHPDGSILSGTIDSKYSFDADKSLKMVATPKMITDTPVGNAPFQAFPVHCPDDVMWSILNETAPPR